MALIDPTLHIEVQLTSSIPQATQQAIRAEVAKWVDQLYKSVEIGSRLEYNKRLKHEKMIGRVQVVDFTGPPQASTWVEVEGVKLDVQTYHLRQPTETGNRRFVEQDDHTSQARSLALPNALLNDEWDSLIFDDALPARLLRYLVRMAAMMSQPDLNLATFNWNRLCLLHGPPGSGKSTLCRALAQKMAIRLGEKFAAADLVEINANAMLSKYFGESGKLIESTFDGVMERAKDGKKLVIVVIDEVETIAGSRKMASGGGECHDGLRATNQLLTALDRLRHLPNVITLCTSNMIEAIDPAFLDRVDIKQYIPSPSTSAIYNIFRSCLNELIRSKLITADDDVPTLATTHMTLHDSLESAGFRLSKVAEKCAKFAVSGRTLRRLPVLGLATYTWGAAQTLDNAVAALEKAVEQEVLSRAE
ncbi:hypothetical protein B0A48_07013 [Cryoendolithus antarcticus]|uniref:AAA+ ATPase domain-containing protein n=1 Tax=Cryoendolithus antarcticus TaxID=1507870 RepID=A0A1V8T7C5_9PEZI|nr:hypothetical protein B0A48_07013 [Cryoendolithus antarcticus]